MSADSPHLSAYERERLDNIARNNARLRELGLAESSSGSALLGLGAVSAPRPKKRKAERPQPTEPQRRSARARQVTAAEVFIADEDESGKVILGGAGASSLAKASEAERAALTHPDEVPISTQDLTAAELTVYEVLRAARNAKARAMDRSMFIVCNDRTLCEMVRQLPTTLDGLYSLFGMGEKKVRAHGQMLLDALAPHVATLSEEHEAARRDNAGGDAAPDVVDAAGAAEGSAVAADGVGAESETEVKPSPKDDGSAEEEPLAMRKRRLQQAPFGSTPRTRAARSAP